MDVATCKLETYVFNFEQQMIGHDFGALDKSFLNAQLLTNDESRW